MPKDNNQNQTLTAGGALFVKLKALGVDYVFANSGTDFPPIIEGLIEAERSGVDLPAAITVPHEHVAMGMAHGYYQISGKAQAVMLHTNVGLANGAIGAINAACDQVPIIMMSGRTPVTEQGRFGARTVPIGWGQEMFDQTAMVREAAKWDYELRFPEQTAEVLDRGWSIANSTPKGPVYVSLPREVLCEPCPPAGLDAPSRMQPVRAAAPQNAIEEAAALIAGAQRPLIIAQRGAGSQVAFEKLSTFVADWAIPLSHYWANQIAIPMGNPSHVTWQPDALLEEADVVLVINALAPWWPDHAAPSADAKVIQLGPDPLFARSTPMRTFPADVTLAGDTDLVLGQLIDAMNGHTKDDTQLAARRTRIEAMAEANRDAVRTQAQKGNNAPMSKEWVSHCLGKIIREQKAQGRKSTVFHELGCPLPALEVDDHLSYFQEPHSGGLGWGLPAAMGAQLADLERLVFASIGDGSYMFANPTACHQVCEALELPVITLVLNNEEWGAVRQSVKGLYKDGLAASANDLPMTSLRPSPDFTKTAEASRAYTETVTNGAGLPDALARAVEVALGDRRQVLLNIAIARG